MRIHKQTFVEQKEVEAVVCNFCGGGVCKDCYGYVCEHVSIEKTWGYGSCFDGETHTVDICMHCYEKLLKQMLVSPNREVREPQLESTAL